MTQLATTRLPPPGDQALRNRLRTAVEALNAPQVVFAFSHDGVRTVCAGGNDRSPDTVNPGSPGTSDGQPGAGPQYQAGSVSKTFSGLLLAVLVQQGRVSYHDRVHTLLDLPAAPQRPERDQITLLHLVTHTSGLPRLPHDFYSHALTRWNVNPYAGYSQQRLVNAFARSTPATTPGSRWKYSNFAVALLACALQRATATPFADLLERHVLAPLGLHQTSLGPHPDLPQATGHRRSGAPLPPWDIGGWAAAGGIHSTTDDLLTYLEAHLRPGNTPSSRALHAVQKPLLARGRPGRREFHTLTWFQHNTDDGPVLFHSGATTGQQMFLGYCPTTRTALVALATRRHTARSPLVPAAYDLLTTAPTPDA
ncbi:serine hydrolase domain-containing protein [Streptomyces sp. RPT161]|uniref:serine hydrolase domain-containing protein n=1 Tax=Streptomyces sp. RPT161 TaxID=3015993 RepID=UPI0022B8FF66|nr:serine hydrolase domain-containing protein [Streptomyces sp. RPT161]